MADIDLSKPMTAEFDWSKPASQQNVLPRGFTASAPTAASQPQASVPQPVMPQQPQPAPQQRTTVGDTLSTMIRGYGQGVTAGLIQYPQAALKSVVTGLPFSESIEDLRRENIRLSQQQPAAWYGGNVIGNVGLGVATGGGSLGAMAAKGATTGAIEGFTQKDSLADAATGAVTGGALSTLFGGAGKAATGYLGNKQIKVFQNDWRNEPLDYKLMLYRKMKGLPDNAPVRPSDVLRTPSANDIKSLYRTLAVEAGAGDIIRGSLPQFGKTLGATVKEAGEQVAGAVPTALAGLATGTAFNAPGLGALIGASLYPAGRAILRQGETPTGPAMLEASRLALMRPELAQRTGMAAQQILQPTAVETAVEQTNPPPIPRKRLVDLANDYRARWSSQQ